MLDNSDIARLAEEISVIAEDPDASRWAPQLQAASHLLTRYADEPLTIEVLDANGNEVASISGDVARRIHSQALVEFFERMLVTPA